MEAVAKGQPDYGNWVSDRFIILPGILAIVFGALGLLYPALWVLAAVMALGSLYFAYARHQLADGKGGIQIKVVGLVLKHVGGWDGKGRALDIGCGNGALAIRLAKANPGAEVVGLDYWGKDWAYSQEACHRNAEAEGVGDRVTFSKASAASLPYDDGTFDVVVSNMVFHEVKEVSDKRLVVREALRVLKKGGWFSFQDLFFWRQVYGDIDEFAEAIRSWGVDTVAVVDTRRSRFIPRALKLPFMLGSVGIIYGRK